MIIRSKAPLRIGLAGGGTDVSPYCDLFGGAILNATVSLYAYASIEPTDSGEIVFQAADRNEHESHSSNDSLDFTGTLDLHKGVYNRIVKDFANKPLSFKLTTYVDAPAGSGLGTSSTLVVAILGAFVEWLHLPLGEYDIAKLAYEIERKDCAMAGGRQDQYAATFGGVNYMEFYKDDKVIVNPLRIKQRYLSELEHNLLLFYTKTGRESAKIIEQQSRNVTEKKTASIEAMHHLKEQSVMMKEALLTGNIDKVGEILDFGWQNKKLMAGGISNELIESIYSAARNAGATGGKISGAGGGGFMIFYCPLNTRYSVINALKDFGGAVKRYTFTGEGLSAWTI
jgi:D-glycero-alpha-D-manno-heptose-7-phosphate kinase